eukprot:TRINITY_DN19939_c0_g1_i1.p1 TRINITY_DN19939_c0_g1~~TRINITY_DN19939_c0_g1_i1.p1  ORF type:complete len:563 (+),score=170.94 TRINITY_DN19939_c0_g1_i1:195-1883(+)
MHVFGEVAAAMHESGTVQGLLQWVLQLMRRITAASSVALFVRQDQGLHRVGVFSVHGGFCGSTRAAIPVGNGLTGHAAVEARIVRVNNPLTDSRFDAQADMECGVHVSSMLIVPVLQSNGSAAAVFRLCNKTGEGDGFDDSDVAAMRVLIDAHMSGVGGFQPEEEILDPDTDSTAAWRATIAAKQAQVQALDPEYDNSAIQELNQEMHQLDARLASRENLQAQLASTSLKVERDSLQVRAKVGEAQLGGRGGREDPGELVKLKAELQSVNRYNTELQAELFTLQLRVQGHSDFCEDQTTVKYVELRKQIESSDLTDMQALQFIDVLGLDCKDRPVVVISGAKIPHDVDRFRLLLHTVEVLRNVASNEYVIVYLNTRDEHDYVHKLDFGWVKQELMLLPMSFRKSIAQVVVLHPDVWFKMQIVGLFLDSNDSQKLVYADTIEAVYEAIGRRRLELPGYVYRASVEKDTFGLSLGRGLEGGKELLAKTKALRHSSKQKQQEISTRRDLLHRNRTSVEWLEKELGGFLEEENYVEAAVVKEDIAALHREIEDLELDLKALEGDTP